MGGESSSGGGSTGGGSLSQQSRAAGLGTPTSVISGTSGRSELDAALAESQAQEAAAAEQAAMDAPAMDMGPVNVASLEAAIGVTDEQRQASASRDRANTLGEEGYGFSSPVSMTEQAKAGLTGVQAASIGPEATSRAADLAAAGMFSGISTSEERAQVTEALGKGEVTYEGTPGFEPSRGLVGGITDWALGTQRTITADTLATAQEKGVVSDLARGMRAGIVQSTPTGVKRDELGTLKTLGTIGFDIASMIISPPASAIQMGYKAASTGYDVFGAIDEAQTLGALEQAGMVDSVTASGFGSSVGTPSSGGTDQRRVAQESAQTGEQSTPVNTLGTTALVDSRVDEEDETMIKRGFASTVRTGYTGLATPTIRKG